ncbi:MAG: TolC family protein, partial [Pseudomonadota bacterium]
AITAEPLTDAELASAADENLANVTAEQEPIRGRVGLFDAMARALKYNLDHKVEVYQAALRYEELDVARFELLPDLVAKSDFARRDNFSASVTRQVVNGDLGPAGAFQTFNTSQDRSRRNADIEFSWHVLDFGLSYVRARQAADKALVAEEARRKVVNRVIEDVRTAYWRAVTAERLVHRLRRLESRTRAALASTRALASEEQASPVTALTYERELVEIKRTIQELQRDLNVAKSQLAALMNVKPGTHFHLKHPRVSGRGLRLPGKVRDMIWTAMNNRPELRDVAYRKRINVHEAHAALLELLPGFDLYAGANYDSNSFLLNNDWLSWGARASWNVMRVFKYPAKRRVIDAQDALLQQRGLAVTMAVITQVHVSRVRFLHARRELSTAQEYFGVQRRLLAKLRSEAASGRISEQTLIREEMNTLVAEVRRDIAHSRLQNAYANLFASMGIDPHSEAYSSDSDLKSLSRSLHNLWHRRGRRTWGARVTALRQ